MVFLTGLLPASCHKSSPQEKTPPPAMVSGTNTASAVSNNRSLGEIALTNNNETCVLFNTGESCTLTPKILDKQNVRITLTLESKDDYGDTRNFAVSQVTGKPGKPLEVAVGGLNLTFTPQVSAGQ
ncbi:MAG TPA: hypothetical protein VL863_03900 [bacterium]|nr:hypothetical protein [bacterium]